MAELGRIACRSACISLRLFDKVGELAVDLVDFAKSLFAKLRWEPRSGRNDITVTYDETTGRPIRAEGVIWDDYGQRTRGDNATQIGHLAGKGEGYDGGHLGAHRFYGDTPDEGITPQFANLNRGAYSTMEKEWGDWAKAGKEVEFSVDVDPPGQVVPDRFKVKYKAIDPATGTQLHYKERVLRNAGGKQFKRLSRADIEKTIKNVLGGT